MRELSGGGADSDCAHWYAEYILSQLPEVRWE